MCGDSHCLKSCEDTAHQIAGQVVVAMLIRHREKWWCQQVEDLLELCWKGSIQNGCDLTCAVDRQQSLEWAIPELCPGDLWVWWCTHSPCFSAALMGLYHFQPKAGSSPSWEMPGQSELGFREKQSLFAHLPQQSSLKHQEICAAESCFVWIVF